MIKKANMLDKKGKAGRLRNLSGKVSILKRIDKWGQSQSHSETIN